MCSSAVAAVQRFGVSHKTPHQDRFSRCGAGSSHVVASCMLACLEFAYIYIHTTTDRHINVYIDFSPLRRPCGGGVYPARSREGWGGALGLHSPTRRARLPTPGSRPSPPGSTSPIMGREDPPGSGGSGEGWVNRPACTNSRIHFLFSFFFSIIYVFFDYIIIKII